MYSPRFQLDDQTKLFTLSRVPDITPRVLPVLNRPIRPVLLPVSVFSLLNNLPLEVEALLSSPSPLKLNPNFCQHCGVVMSNTRITSLIEHCRTCPAMARPDVYKYKFVCYACNYFTYQVSNIKNHILIHLGAKPFMCEFCQCTFRHNHHLQRHMKTHVKGMLTGIGWPDGLFDVKPDVKPSSLTDKLVNGSTGERHAVAAP